MRAHPLRSLLTVLGVVTGVAAVITVIAVGEGSRRSVMRQLELLGSRLLVVLPGPASGGAGGRDSLTREDAEAIAREVEGSRVSPEVLGRAVLKRGRETVSAPVVGATPEFALIRNFELARGRFFTAGEERGRARVCVLGSRSAERLSDGREVLDAEITVDRVRYRVIGVFEQKGDLGWFHPDDMAVIPLSTAQTRLLGIDHAHAIAVEVPAGRSREEVHAKVLALLRRLHRIPADVPKDRLDFHVISQKEMIEAMSNVNRTLTALLISLAAVALITGGVGIMNIMLVSVTERTSEIGLRKAVGAAGSDIFFQFLLEAVILSGAGAAIGVGLGGWASGFLSEWGGWELVVSWRGIGLSVGAALVTGAVFGIYPATRAAGLEPVEALRA